MNTKPSKKEILKDLLKRIHKGENVEALKKDFKDVISGVTESDIVKMEEELIKEGVPKEEIMRLCDVHLALFEETLGKEKTLAPPGHAIYILMEEHKKLLEFAGHLNNLAGEIKGALSGEEAEHLNHIAEHFKESEKHYVREENVLFPYVEKHGITGPPSVMWTEHQKIREIKKNLYKLIETPKDKNFASRLKEISAELAETLSSHFYKENNILFPMALQVLAQSEWSEVRAQFDEIGYCCFSPEVEPVKEEVSVSKPEPKGAIALDTGYFSLNELETIFNTLPVEITFVDKDDTVRYFSNPSEKIFPRTKAIIGRTVQNCHPQKSIHLVNQILGEFKSGKRNAAEFWITLNGRLVYIRYFALRNERKEYLGCMEVTQDITDIKKIEGEKRLL